MRFPSNRWPVVAGAALAGVLSVLAAACSAATAGPVPALEKTNITVDVSSTVDYAGLFIAQEEGLFRQQGLNVTITFAPASRLAVTSVVNGTSDIAGSDYVTYIDSELTDGAKLRIVAEASSLKSGDLGMFVRAGSRVTTLAQLRGRTIGVTSSDDIDTLLIRALLAENGIKADSVSIQFGFQLLNMAQQLSEGQADAAPIPEPFASEGQQQFGLQELVDVDQGVTTDFPLEGYAVSQVWARHNPRTLAAFDRALEEGQEIADTNRPVLEAAVEKYLGIKPETAAVISLPDYPLSVAPVQLQRVADAMVQFGMLPPKDASFKVTRMTG